MRQESLRVLMVAPQPFFRPRGTPVSVLHRIRGLQALGHRVDLHTYPFGTDPELPDLRIHRSRRPPFVRDVGIGPSVAKALLDLPLFAAVRRAAASDRYNLIHTHEEAGFLGAVLSRRYGLPHVYDMHSSLPQQFWNFGRFNWRIVVGLFRRLEGFALAHSVGVITVYPHLRDQVETRGFRGPLALLENTLDFQRPEPRSDRTARMRTRLGLEGAPVAVYTGTLETYQGLDLLVAAARFLKRTRPEVRIVVVGGSGAQAASLRSRVEAAGAARLFRILPAVPPQEVFDYHDLADVLVTCRTRGMNTPLKIYQYLRSRKPIVATSIPAHTQVLTPDVAELVEPEPAAVAHGIQRVLDDPRHAYRLTREAERVHRERYSEEAYMQTLREFMDAVERSSSLAGSGPPPTESSAPPRRADPEG